jgi:diacylglycerol kinase family enzyme
MWSWPRPRLRLRTGGREIDCEAVYVAKGRWFAGPWQFAPARLADPRLHVVALPALTRLRFLHFVALLLLGKLPQGRAGYVCLQCATLEIESRAPHPLQADGDPMGHAPARLAVDPLPWDAVCEPAAP